MNSKKLFLICLFALLFITSVFAEDIDEDEEYVPNEKIKEAIEKENVNEPLIQKDEEPVPLNYNTETNFFKVMKLDNPTVEICLVSALAIYLVVFFIGKSKNEKIAKNWLISTYNIWKENFAELGIEDASTLVRDGDHEFWYYATGRKYCQSVFTRVQLRPRQDIIATLLKINKPNYDKIVMETVLNKNESDDFVFALMDRRLETDIKKGRYDLKTFTRRFKGNNAPDQFYYTVLTDAFDFATRFFDNTFVKHAIQLSLGELDNPVSKRNNPWIESIIITDQPTAEPDIDKILSEEPPLPPKKTLTVTVRIPSDYDKKTDDMEALVVELTELVIRIIDFIGEHGKVDLDTRNKLKKTRDAAKAAITHKIEEKNKEELNKKKLEQKRARAADVSKMSAEKQENMKKSFTKKNLRNHLRRSLRKLK